MKLKGTEGEYYVFKSGWLLPFEHLPVLISIVENASVFLKN